MNNITAYIKEATPVSAHEDIVGAISDPVKVVSIDGQGARVVEGLPEGRVVIYDIVEYDEVEREEFHPEGFTKTSEGYWIQKFSQKTHIDQVPRTETYAVRVDEPSEGVDPVWTEPAPVLPGRGDDDGGGEVTEFLGESQG